MFSVEHIDNIAVRTPQKADTLTERVQSTDPELGVLCYLSYAWMLTILFELILIRESVASVLSAKI